MTVETESSPEEHRSAPSRRLAVAEVILLTMLFFVYAGDPSPMVNEAHYLVKAKNFWDPTWCANDLFAASGKAHTTFYALFGWPTRFVSLEATAWIGRVIGWIMIAIGLRQLSARLIRVPWACVGVAVLWIAGIEHGNLAGEWVVGGIEAKVPAYGLVLFALSELIEKRWNRVWILLGAASAFHVLSGGWAVIAAMIAWWMTARGQSEGSADESSWLGRRHLLTPGLFLGGALALFGLIPALWLNNGVGPEDSVAAARIYAYFRIKHHLLPADFLATWYLRHGILLALTTALGWYFHRTARSEPWTRVYAFTVGVVVIAIVGLGVGILPYVAPDLGAKLLRYYWFRLTDAIVPLMLALLLVRCLVQKAVVVKTAGMIGLAISILLVSISAIDRARTGVPPSVSNRLLGWDVEASGEQQRAVRDDWLSVCSWVKAATDDDAVLLTPRHQQTFKWYAERSEVVNWKDVPQDAKSLREWYRRFRDVFPVRLGTVRVTIQYEHLRRFREDYGADFIVVDRRVTGSNLPLVKLYPRGDETNETYAVYELP